MNTGSSKVLSISQKLSLYDGVKIDDVEELLTPISKAVQSVRLSILDSAFHERELIFKKRKQQQRKNILRKKLKET